MTGPAEVGGGAIGADYATGDVTVRPIGHVRSTLVDPMAAPRQNDEGGVPATVVLRDES